MTQRGDRIVWMDLEMTGLDAERERIIEIAVLVTDAKLTVIAEGPNLVVHQDDAILSAMDAWNTEHHGASGLTQRVKASTLSEEDAETQVLDFLKEHCEPRAAPLAGNSIHQDRRFIRRYMKRVDAFLHYRLIDVTTVKELLRRWNPDVVAKAPEKKENHRALDDIYESLKELTHYRDHGFVLPPKTGEPQDTSQNPT